MYLTGLGVVQNTDAGLDWLKQAGERYQDPPALYNLALVYGTGTIVSSYKLCAVPENLQRADSYLVQAANLGYGPAQRLVNKYGSLLVSDRWEKIKAELELDEFHKQHMESVGEACQPNPD